MSVAAFVPSPLGEASGLAPRRTIPFDYSFSYRLEGDLNKVTSKTVTVSIEASFTAVAIGYGVIPDTERVTFGLEQLQDIDVPANPGGPPRLVFAARPAASFVLPMLSEELIKSLTTLASEVGPGIQKKGLVVKNLKDALAKLVKGDEEPGRALLSDIVHQAEILHQADNLRDVLLPPARQVTIGDLIRALARVLGEEDFNKSGEIGPKTEAALLNGIRLNPQVARYFLLDSKNVSLDADQLANLFETLVDPPESIQFLYALYDEGTGREFQSAPILNIAGLGIADGDRPFRYFAQPITFAPRTTIRLDITEKSEFKGELHISLHGYKVLGEAGTPTGRAGRPRRLRRFR